MFCMEQAINEKIMSLNYEDHTVEIKTADAQESHEKGVIVLVTGCLTGKDNARRKFTQTFFLAPQDKGYFVLNDVFRYVGESESLVNGTSENAPAVALTPELGGFLSSVYDLFLSTSSSHLKYYILCGVQGP